MASFKKILAAIDTLEAQLLEKGINVLVCMVADRIEATLIDDSGVKETYTCFPAVSLKLFTAPSGKTITI